MTCWKQAQRSKHVLDGTWNDVDFATLARAIPSSLTHRSPYLGRDLVNLGIWTLRTDFLRRLPARLVLFVLPCVDPRFAGSFINTNCECTQLFLVLPQENVPCGSGSCALASAILNSSASTPTALLSATARQSLECETFDNCWQ